MKTKQIREEDFRDDLAALLKKHGYWCPVADAEEHIQAARLEGQQQALQWVRSLMCCVPYQYESTDWLDAALKRIHDGKPMEDMNP